MKEKSKRSEKMNLFMGGFLILVGTVVFICGILGESIVYSSTPISAWILVICVGLIQLWMGISTLSDEFDKKMERVILENRL